MTSRRSCLCVLALLVSAVAHGAPESSRPAAGRPRSVGDSRAPSTVGDLLNAVDRWVVAIRVKRSKDLDRSRFQPRVVYREARQYFRRPDGYVTGLLVDRQGYILTSLYNVGGTLESIEVVFPDGEKRAAELLATDEMDDLALLRLEGEKAAVAEEDWSEPPWSDRAPAAGRIVFAVGRSPDPRRLTVTQGIVSAAGRNGDRAFQTDAKLNYGNVGGPLLDLDGRIVGVSGFVGHTYPQWGLNSGIGFGTAAPAVCGVLERLKKGENVRSPAPPFLGVRSDEEDFGVQGARIGAVVEESAAARAGLRSGDVIVELGGKSIAHFSQLRHQIFEHKVGEKVKIVILRDGKRLELELELGRRRGGRL